MSVGVIKLNVPLTVSICLLRDFISNAATFPIFCSGNGSSPKISVGGFCDLLELFDGIAELGPVAGPWVPKK